jgi:copper ion binding protein
MTKEFTVNDMSCQHCVTTITTEVARVPGVQAVTVDLERKQVTVNADEQVAPETIVGAINEAGYTEVTVLS